MTIIRKPVERQPFRPHPSHKYAMACYIIDQCNKAIEKEQALTERLMAEAQAKFDPVVGKMQSG